MGTETIIRGLAGPSQPCARIREAEACMFRSYDPKTWLPVAGSPQGCRRADELNPLKAQLGWRAAVASAAAKVAGLVAASVAGLRLPVAQGCRS